VVKEREVSTRDGEFGAAVGLKGVDCWDAGFGGVGNTCLTEGLE